MQVTHDVGHLQENFDLFCLYELGARSSHGTNRWTDKMKSVMRPARGTAK